MRLSTRVLVCLVSLLSMALPGISWAVSIDWVTVGDAGNACDTQNQGCFGAVADVYRISKYETTNAQYAEFLNAKAASDPLGLYHLTMGSGGHGGITRSGSSGSYSAIAGRGDMPVNYVSFYDSLRFANWLNNGQGSGDTETGAYTITASGISNNSITRNAGANIFLTGEDEWYKAAYYDTSTLSYYDYPAGANTATTCASPGATANTANCSGAVADVTVVGSYTGSMSPYGTFDQGGNVKEWNEAISVSNRVVRGGGFDGGPGNIVASDRDLGGPILASSNLGFRVASVPEPSTGLLLATGLTALGLSRRFHTQRSSK